MTASSEKRFYTAGGQSPLSGNPPEGSLDDPYWTFDQGDRIRYRWDFGQASHRAQWINRSYEHEGETPPLEVGGDLADGDPVSGDFIRIRNTPDPARPVNWGMSGLTALGIGLPFQPTDFDIGLDDTLTFRMYANLIQTDRPDVGVVPSGTRDFSLVDIEAANEGSVVSCWWGVRNQWPPMIAPQWSLYASAWQWASSGPFYATAHEFTTGPIQQGNLGPHEWDEEVDDPWNHPFMPWFLFNIPKFYQYEAHFYACELEITKAVDYRVPPGT